MKKHKTVAEFLKCAKAILVKKGWCQGSYAVTKGGLTIGPTERSAAKFCMIGALKKCDGDVSSSMYFDARGRLREALGTWPIATFNDEPQRTKKQVLEKFDKAIKLASAHD